jgi:hypothetical protein
MAALGHHFAKLYYLLGVSAGVELFGTYCVWQAKAMKSKFVIHFIFERSIFA